MENNHRINLRIKWIGLTTVILVQFVMHLNHFNADLVGVHLWRQTQTQATIDSFYVEDFNILNPRKLDRGDGDGIHRREFPLVQWSIAGIYKIFGKQLIITRIFMFAISMLAIIGMFSLLRNLLRSHWAAIIGASAFSFAPSIFYHGINPMPDVAALCAVIWGLSLMVKWRSEVKIKYVLLSALLFGVSAAIKLPFVLLYLAPTVLLLQLLLNPTVEFKRIKIVGVGLIYLLFILPAAIWYINVIPAWNTGGIVSGLTNSEDGIAELLHYLMHNVISTLPELLLNWASVILFFIGLVFIVFRGGKRNVHFVPLMFAGAGVAAYYVFELNMIQDRHDYYAFPFMPLLFIAVGVGARFLLSKSVLMKSLLVLCVLLAPVLTFLRKGHAWNQDNMELIAFKDELQSAVPSDALCIIGNDESGFIYFYHLNKKGWSFKDDDLSEARINELKEKGAQYLYSDSEVTNQFVERNLGLSQVSEIGSFRVYKL
jgi:hypothetical protein